jgi:hypothetical protein
MERIKSMKMKFTTGLSIAATALSFLATRVTAVDLQERYPTRLSAGDTDPNHARAWEFNAEDIFHVSQFELKIGDKLKVETGPGDLGIGHGTDGAVWAVLLPREQGTLTSPAADKSEPIANVWLRFHPAQINRLFPPKTVSADGDTNLLSQIRSVVNAKFRSSWHAGMNAMIPEPKDLTVYVDTKDGAHRFFVVDTEAQTAEYLDAFNQHSLSASRIKGVITTDTIETELGRAISESSPGKREAELNHLQRTIANDDLPAALAFLARNGETGRHSLFGDLASRWASQNPDVAIAWATNLPDAGARKSALINALKGWTQVSPEAAAAYTTTLPAGKLHDDAVLMVAGEWAFHDAYGAAKWVSHFPKGTLRDKAVGPIIFWGQGQAPAAVAEMLDTIGDTNLIQQNGETIASIWLQRDDAAARAWIKKSPLSDEVKQRLLKSN